MPRIAPIPTCSCCADLLHGAFNRRHVMKMIGGAGVAMAFPFAAWSAEGDYEAMLLSCIDPRLPQHTLDYMNGRKLAGQYSQFSIAGAAIGVVAPKFKAWRPAFWENLAASVELHKITKVIAINHHDCGAAEIAYGKDKVATPERETETHRKALAEFRKEANKRQPKLAVETGLMGLDGKVEMFT